MAQKSFPTGEFEARKYGDDATSTLTGHVIFTLEAPSVQIHVKIEIDDRNKQRKFYGYACDGLVFVCMIDNKEERINQVYGGYGDYILKGKPFDKIDQNTVRVKCCIK